MDMDYETTLCFLSGQVLQWGVDGLPTQHNHGNNVCRGEKFRTIVLLKNSNKMTCKIQALLSLWLKHLRSPAFHCSGQVVFSPQIS